MEKVFCAANKKPDFSGLFWVKFAGGSVLIIAGHHPLLPDVFPKGRRHSQARILCRTWTLLRVLRSCLGMSEFQTSSLWQLITIGEEQNVHRLHIRSIRSFQRSRQAFLSVDAASKTPALELLHSNDFLTQSRESTLFQRKMSSFWSQKSWFLLYFHCSDIGQRSVIVTKLCQVSCLFYLLMFFISELAVSLINEFIQKHPREPTAREQNIFLIRPGKIPLLFFI